MAEKTFETRGFWVVDGELGSDVMDIGKRAGRANSVVVALYPQEASPWSARFWGGAEKGLTQIFAWPRSSLICVAVNGIAFLGDIEGPDSWEELEPEPVQGALAFPDHKRIILYDRWRAYCFGVEGKIWSTHDLAIDGFTVHAVHANSFDVRIELDRDDFQVRRVEVITGRVRDL